MFDVSFSELLLIGVVALIVIGPERLPRVARTAGHLLGRAQRYVSDIKSDIQREIEASEISDLKDDLESASSALKSSFEETEKSLQQSAHDIEKSFQHPLDEATSQITAPQTSKTTPSNATPNKNGNQSKLSATDDDGPKSAADLDPFTLPLPGLDDDKAPLATQASQSTTPSSAHKPSSDKNTP